MTEKGVLPLIGVVIPAHNRMHKTLRCLESLFVARCGGMRLDVIVVDDGSTDGTYEAIQQRYPAVHLLKGSGTLYWTAAVNLGIQKALDRECQWVLILNDDTVHDPDFIVHLLHCARNHPDAIIGARIMYLSNPDTIRFAGAAWTIGRFGWHYPDAGKPGSNVGMEPYEVESINGNCCLIPSHVLRRHGLYDEINFPHCYADSVFTILVHKKGVPLLIEPKACAWDDDSDLVDKLTGPYLRGKALIKHVFFSKLSAYYWRTLFLLYWWTPPSRLEGMLLLAYRLARISTRVFLALTGIRPFNKGLSSISGGNSNSSGLTGSVTDEGIPLSRN